MRESKQGILCLIFLNLVYFKTMKVGVLGGTFDPIHNGHLIVSEYLRQKFGFAKIIFVPAADAWHKKAAIAKAQDRLALINLAIKENPNFEVSEVDIKRGSPTYSVDTISDLRKQYGEGVQISFLMGTDIALTLPKWHLPEKFLNSCEVIVFKRFPIKKSFWEKLEKDLPQARKQIILVDAPKIEISSTQIRALLSKNYSIRYLVSDSVNTYIKNYSLYLGKMD